MKQQHKRIAIIDIGKTNAKVLVLDSLSGVELEVRRQPNKLLHASPYPHYDIDGLWAFFCDALRDLYADPGFDAISITTHGAACALLDSTGHLALPVLDYEFEYPEAIRAAYADMRPAFAETLSPALPCGLNLGAQIHFLKSQFPNEFKKVASLLTYAQYWAFRLTGVAANEVTSLGCHTDLWRPAEQSFSSLVDELELGDKLAPVRSAFDVLGPVKPELASNLGLQNSVPVYCGIHDSNASLLPHLMSRKAPFSVVSTGTWAIHFAVDGDLEHLDPARDTLANVDAYGRAVPSSRFMGGREFELLVGELGPFDPLAAEQAVSKVLRQGIMLMPNLVPGSGPYPQERARWLHSQDASLQEKWSAACLYLALMTQTCLDLIGAKGPIVVEGPFSANPVYLKALGAFTSRPVYAVSGSTGTSQGASLLAGGISPEASVRVESDYDPDLMQLYAQSWKSELRLVLKT